MYGHAIGVFKIGFMVLMDGALSSGTTWVVHNIEEFFEK
jgi:hypothetical protein